MNIEELNGQSWYLAQYITGGKNRERLFDWLSEQQITPWTPLTVRTIRRTDKINCVRRFVTPLFPGYFFLKANLAIQTVDKIRRHLAFCGFVMNGSQLAPLRPSIVTGLMKQYPTRLNSIAEDEITAAADTWLTHKQYQYLLHLEQHPHTTSRVALLMQLVFEPSLLGFK
ncbi:transcription termination factor NusG (plasmid) [Edwardsiella tarda]|uniref:transcription termination/antitermination NusG family protein n=1 Tax=Edwardsiella tarda TaxID=636 RepID=UPI00351C120F